MATERDGSDTEPAAAPDGSADRVDPTAPTAVTEVGTDADVTASAITDSLSTYGVRPVDLPERYVDLGLIGRGGMGEVRRVRDVPLDQVLAMKLIRAPLAHHARGRARFLREARLTAGLQHPGIVSVHDMGELADGRLWFTMREVRGRTLQAVIDELHRASGPEGWGTPLDGWHLRRVLAAFEQACQAVAYAHSQGALHRDLKPENIMVGAFGEVLVMDWGIARLVDDAATTGVIEAAYDDDPLGLDVDATRVGAVLGSPAYMAPEQARGEVHRHGPATDVWALGAILSTILVGYPPRRRPDGHRAPPAPPELGALADWAMTVEVVDRPADATVFAAELRAWLDGARRREQAEALIEQADRSAPDVQAWRAQAAALRLRAAAILGPLPPHAPDTQKKPGWRLEDEAAALERRAEQKAMAVDQGLRSALSLADLPAAHARLARRARERLIDAEARRDGLEAVRAETLLRAHGTADDIAWLDGPGALSLVTDPPGAHVTARRLYVDDRRLVEGPPVPLGVTPLRARTVERGRYVLEIEHPDRPVVRYPVRIDRGQHWHGVPPDGEAAHPIVLPDGLGPDDCHVPAGWFVAGGDPEAIDPFDRRTLWLPGFVMQRFPVTVGRYRAFLDALVGRGRADDAARHQPIKRGGVDGEPRPLFRRVGERFGEAVDGSGRVWSDDTPVALVDRAGAEAYARWWSSETGHRWRLPDDLMWEKAARGVDGRYFPWGDFFEPTWACTAGSHAARPALASVRAHPTDVSPYGVRGLAGGVRDWCATGYRRDAPPDGGRADEQAPAEGPFVMVRGGSWHSTPAFCRVANRFATRPDDRLSAVGFRLCRWLD